LVLLAVIGGGIWYFFWRPEELALKVTPGPVEVNPKDGLTYVWIPPGSFRMGCSRWDFECGDDEKPPHQVSITRGFWLGQTEVTVGAYKRFAGATGKRMPFTPDFNSDWATDSMPIVNVRWGDAQAYCAWAGGRLPTEAEWEYAARAASMGARYGSLDEIAWYDGNSGSQTHPVGQKRANGFGLYDMLGNVWQWVNDWADQNYYQNSPFQDPSGPTIGKLRVLRGGSMRASNRDVRVSCRNSAGPDYLGDDSGFRCAREPVVNPPAESGAPQTGTGQQGPVVETPAATVQSPTESETGTAGRRKQVEAAKRQGDNYYENGEYDKAINAYQGGLKLAPSNAQLLKALQRAQTAKAAEEKLNQ
jgi:formylglycine-generating enzyme required for sulfatase activity